MKNMFICPKCLSKRSLDFCECKFKLKSRNGVYDFLDKSYKSDFDEIGYMYYSNDSSLIQEQIATEISRMISSGNVLDLGSGAGHIASALLKYQYNFICLDSSFVMFEIFKKRLSTLEYNEDLLTLIRADAHRIPLENASIDLVIVSNLFHLLAEPKTVLAEIYRILSPTGKLLLISDSNDNEYFEFGEELAEYNNMVNTYNNLYWEKMKEHKIFPRKADTSFNQYLEASKLFKKHYFIETAEIEYRGVIKLKDFLEKEYSKSSYAKSNIPSSIHLDVHEEAFKNLFYKKRTDLLNIEVYYKGKNKSIIDVYEK